jgi:hypothetical protein
MLHVFANKHSEYTANFDDMQLHITARVSRLTRKVKIKFSQSEVKFTCTEAVPAEVLMNLIPMYSRYLDELPKREAGKQLMKSLDFDIWDGAIRNFCSFGGPAGS